MKYLKLAVLLVTTSFFFFSCKKDDNTTTTNCQVIKSYSLDTTGAKEDSANYFYTNGKVTKVEIIGSDYFTLEYNGNYVTRRSYYTANSSTPYQFEQVTYNADNTINKVESLTKGSTGFTVDYRADFTYASGRLATLTLSSITNNTPSVDEKYEYTYSGDNITIAKVTDAQGTSTFNYTYDSNSNYLKKQNSQYLFVDPFLGSVDGIFFPIIASANNAVSVSASGSTITLGYDVDSKSNVKTVSINNHPSIAYEYQCK